MTLAEFMKNTGVRLSFLCEKIGITRQTVYRIKKGESVSPEVAQKVKDYCGQDVEISVVQSEKSHVRNRRKNTLVLL